MKGWIVDPCSSFPLSFLQLAKVVILTLAFSVLIRPIAAQVSCPPIPWWGYTFQQNAHVTVWIDMRSGGFNGTQASDIEFILDKWNQVSGVVFTPIRATSAFPDDRNGTAANPIWKISIGPQTNGRDALTNTQFNNYLSTTILTTFNTSWLTAATDDALKGLMSHETVHPFGEGECDPSVNSACTTVAANNNGNTNQSPTPCDLNTISANQNNHANAPIGPASGSGDGDTCIGSPQNDTCSCYGGSYVCVCDGAPATCSDGSEQECDGGQWSCPTVSSCEGDPTCDAGEEAVCVNNQWQCQSNGSGSGCSDVCDPSCSDYDYCSCYPQECGAPPCNDDCDPSCPSYDPEACGGACECDYSCDYAVPEGDIPAVSTPTPNEIAHPMCNNNHPAILPSRISGPVIAAAESWYERRRYGHHA